MKIILPLLITAAITALQTVKAQTTSSDSVEIVRAAKRDAHRFRLSRTDYNKFKTEHFPATSDYFKPSAHATSNTALLHDSLYIRSYHTAAFYTALDQRNIPTLHDLTPANHRAAFGLLTTTYTAADQQTARKDAQRFSLTYYMLKKFKDAPFPATSDYFTPAAENASDPALLSDSAYVKTFRFEAFNKTYHQRLHPVGHALLIAGGATVGAVLIVVSAIALVRAAHFY